MGREHYTTIDDLIQLSQELLAKLINLGGYRHPLAVRRGVNYMTDHNESSKQVKAGSKTYFFDLKKTKEEKPYLIITESRFLGEGKERERNSIIVFPDHAEEFGKTLTEMVEKLDK
jgi:hypothetical protein